MIPNLTLLIAAYIVFRALEAMLQSSSRFSSDGAKTGVVLAALLLIFFAGVVSFDTVAAGVSTTSALENMQQQLRLLK